MSTDLSGVRVLRLDPFPGAHTDDATPGDLAFSDDGRYLAVTSQACELVVLRTEDFCEHLRVNAGSLWGQDVQWVPGTHLITKRVLAGAGAADEDAPTRAHDIDTGAEVDVPAQPREFRSPGGRFRADHGFGRHRADGGYGGFEGYGAWVDVLDASDGVSRRLHLPRGKAHVHGVSFTADETRMFVGQGGDVHVVDPLTGRVLDTITGIGPGPVVRPDGAVLAAEAADGSFGEEVAVGLWLIDGTPLARFDTGGHYLPALAWSPDGRMLAASVIERLDGHGGEVLICRP